MENSNLFAAPMNPSKGKLLISEPFMYDVNFIRSVVLLVEHNEQGSVGFVLNQPLQIHLRDALENFPAINPLLFRGGPCETSTLHYIHTAGKIIEGSTEICDGIYWGGNHEQMLQLFHEEKIHENQFRFFVGYSGWGPKQLMGEMDNKTWIVTQPNFEYLFNTPADALWKTVLKNMGNEYKIIANAPLDPNWN